MTMPGVFITGTDTSVGKTVVAAAILAALRARGADALPMKPVQTGCAGPSSDLAHCLQAADLQIAPADEALLCPYVFPAACSPHLAARQAGVTISIRRILDCAAELQKRGHTVVAEGAGGVLVPLNDNETMLDLMLQLAFPVVVVARPELGTLNHTLLTLRALREARLNVEALFLSERTPRSWGAIEEDNLQTLRRLCAAPVIARFPHCPGADIAAATAAVHPVIARLLLT